MQSFSAVARNVCGNRRRPGPAADFRRRPPPQLPAISTNSTTTWCR